MPYRQSQYVESSELRDARRGPFVFKPLRLRDSAVRNVFGDYFTEYQRSGGGASTQRFLRRKSLTTLMSRASQRSRRQKTSAVPTLGSTLAASRKAFCASFLRLDCQSAIACSTSMALEFGSALSAMAHSASEPS